MTRSTEWLLSCLLLVWGANVLRPDSFFDLPVYSVMGTVMTETKWGMLAVMVGILRVVGLSINGWWKRTPVIRFIGALTGGLCWLAIGFLMMVACYALNARLPAGFGWYPVLYHLRRLVRPGDALRHEQERFSVEWSGAETCHLRTRSSGSIS